MRLLHKAASVLVDKFVLDNHSLNSLLDGILTAQQTQDATDNQPLTVHGRFPCRFPGCQRSFKFDGASRRKHEQTHHPSSSIENDGSPRSISEPEDSTSPEDSSKTKGDDVYSYNCALLTDGLFFLNFLDAISEGDGQRLMRQSNTCFLTAGQMANTVTSMHCNVSINHFVLPPFSPQETVKDLSRTEL